MLSKLRLSPEFQPAEEQVQRSGPLNLTQEAGTGYSTWHLVQHQHLVQLLASATVLASIGQLWHLLNFSIRLLQLLASVPALKSRRVLAYATVLSSATALGLWSSADIFSLAKASGPALASATVMASDTALGMQSSPGIYYISWHLVLRWHLV